MAILTESFTDPDFGPLSWDAELHRWSGTISMAGREPVTLSINPLAAMTQVPPYDDATIDKTITEETRRVLPRVRKSDAIFREAIATEFFPSYRRWGEADKISEAEFTNRIRLEEIVLYPDGMAEALFDDDGMFGGHCLIAHLDKDGVVGDVELFG